MRTDLVAGYLVQEWLLTHAPDLAGDWRLDVGEEVKGFAARVKGMYEFMDAIFASQSALARTAIEAWSLQEVAILGGGTPTPLSPHPQQVKYFTDANPEVVAEAATLGYSTLIVDVKKSTDLDKLIGAKVAIATGLFHFLDDAAIHTLLSYLAQVGIEEIIFNNVDPVTSQELLNQWNRTGNQMYARTVADMQSVLPSRWQCKRAEPFVDFIQQQPQIGHLLADQPNLYFVYHITCF